MKKLLCKLFGHRIKWYQFDEYFSWGICNKCHREFHKYKVDAKDWVGIIGSSGTN